jgi:plasmid stabilization system protein ParE
MAVVERSPLIYPIVERDIRKASVGRFPYLVYFVVLSKSISVIAVLHGRRDPKTWSERR